MTSEKSTSQPVGVSLSFGQNLSFFTRELLFHFVINDTFEVVLSLLSFGRELSHRSRSREYNCLSQGLSPDVRIALAWSTNADFSAKTTILLVRTPKIS